MHWCIKETIKNQAVIKFWDLSGHCVKNDRNRAFFHISVHTNDEDFKHKIPVTNFQLKLSMAKSWAN